jgi:hypothetical protein
MSSITISANSRSQGKQVDEKVAKKLGYECIGPEIIQVNIDFAAYGGAIGTLNLRIIHKISEKV